jgi:hypothetical protein
MIELRSAAIPAVLGKPLGKIEREGQASLAGPVGR